MRITRQAVVCCNHEKTIALEKIVFTDKIVCNKCEAVLWDVEIGGPNPQQFAHFSKEWNKNSAFAGETHEFDLCERCYADLVESLRLHAIPRKHKGSSHL